MAKKAKAAGQPPTRTVLAGKQELFSVQVSSEGELLITGGWDGSRAWDFTTGAAVRHYEATPTRGSVNWQTAISSDGKRVVAGYGDLSLSFYDGCDGTVVREHRNLDGIICSVAISANNRYVLTGQPQKKIVLWDLETGDRLREFKALRSYCWKIALSPDGTVGVSASGPDKLLHVWDLAAEQERKAVEGHDKTIESLAFSSDGTTVATGSKDRSVRLWNVTSQGGASVAKLEGPRKPVSGVAFSSDGKQVAASSADGSVYVWTVADRTLWVGDAGESLHSVAFAPNGEVVGGGNGVAYVWAIPG